MLCRSDASPQLTDLECALALVHAASALSTDGQMHHQQLTGLGCALPVGCSTADSQHWSVLRLSYMLLVPRRSDAAPKLTGWGVLCRSDAALQLTGLGCALTLVHAASALSFSSSRKPDVEAMNGVVTLD